MKLNDAKRRALALLVAVAMMLQSPAMAFAADADADNDESNTVGYSQQIDDEDEPEEPADDPADDPEEPAEPADPVDDPTDPADPVDPADEPADPADEPADPVDDPEEPAEPTDPVDPVDPVDPAAPEGEKKEESDAEKRKNAEPQDTIEVEMEYISDEIDLPDSEELFEGYFEREFFGYGISAIGTTAGDRLSGTSKKLYDALAEKIKAVANGESASTEFVCDDITITITGENLISGNKLTEEASNKINEILYAVSDALRSDLPYDLYWFDKTEGWAGSYGVSGNSTSLTLTSLTFKYAVANAYKGSNLYTADTTKTGAAKAAAENAKTVINNNNDKSDDDKLAAYRDYICNAVSYNDDAADNENTPYGDPWQLIYVFDGNSSTNVVCEGYSKAFQYLCDLTDFTDKSIECWSVTGDVGEADETGEGHMWNVVKKGTTNYHCDITWVDSGFTDFFMNDSATMAADNSYYTLTHNSRQYKYAYDTDMQDLYCDGYPVIGNTSSEVLSWKVEDETTSRTHTVTAKSYNDFTLEPVVLDKTITSCRIDYSLSDEDIAKDVLYIKEATGAYSKLQTFETVGAAQITLRGKKAGEVTLTATISYSQNGAVKTDSITCTVKIEKAKIRLNGMTVSNPNANIWKKAYDGTTTVALEEIPEIGGISADGSQYVNDFGGSGSFEVTKAEFVDPDAGNNKIAIYTFALKGSAVDCFEFDTETKQVTVTGTDKTITLAGNQWYTANNMISPKPLSYSDFALYKEGTIYSKDSEEVLEKQFDNTADFSGEGYKIVLKDRPEGADIKDYAVDYSGGYIFVDSEGNEVKEASDNVFVALKNEFSTPTGGAFKNNYTMTSTMPGESSLPTIAKGKITKAKITPTVSTPPSKTYDGTADCGDVTIQAEFNNTGYFYTVSGNRFADKNAGKDKTVILGNDITLQPQKSGGIDLTEEDRFIINNIELVGLDTLEVKGKIEPREVKVTISGPVTYAFTGSFCVENLHSFTYSEEQPEDGGLVEGDTISPLIWFYNQSDNNDLGATARNVRDIGKYTVKVEARDEKNYTITHDAFTFELTRGNVEIPEKTITKYIRYNDFEAKTIDANLIATINGGACDAKSIEITKVEQEKVDGDDTFATPTVVNIPDSYGVHPGLQYQLNNRGITEYSADKFKPITITYTYTPASSQYAAVEGLKLIVYVIDKDPIEGMELDGADDKVYDGGSISISFKNYDFTKLEGYQSTNEKYEYQFTGTKLNGDTYNETYAPFEPGNYTVTATYSTDTHKGIVTKEFKILQRQLTVDGLTAADREYKKGITTADVSGGYVLSGLSGSDLNVELGWEESYSAPSYSFADDKVGENKAVTPNHWKVKLTGTSAWKYIAPEQPELSASITKCNVSADTINPVSAITKEYDGTTALPSGTKFKFSHNGSDIEFTTTGGSFASKNAGSNITVNPGTVADTEITECFDIPEFTASGTITPKEVDVKISGDDVVVYNGYYSNYAEFTASDAVIAGDTVNITLTYKDKDNNVVAEPENAGEYTISASLDNSNYKIKNTTGVATLTINPASISTFNEKIEKKVYYYDDTEYSISVADIAPKYSGKLLDGTIGITEVTGDKGLFEVIPDEDTDTLKYKLKSELADTASGEIVVHWTFTPNPANWNDVTGTFTVKVVPREALSDIVIGLDDITYGETLAAPTYSSETVSGHTNGTWTVTYSGKKADSSSYAESATAPTEPGDYTVKASYLSPTHKGEKTRNFKIAKKELTLNATTLAPQDKTYDGTTDVTMNGGITLSGVLTGDTVSLTAPTAFAYQFADKNAGNDKAVSITNWSDAAIDGTDAWKYALSAASAPALTADIAKKAVTAEYDSSSADNTKVYDGNTTAKDLAYKFTGVGSDGEITVTVKGNKYASRNVGDDIAITLGVQEATGDIGNYDITLAPVTGRITPAELTVYISGTATTEYGGDYSHSAVITDGLAEDDIDNGVSVQMRIVYKNGSGVVASPEDAAAYQLTCEVVDNNNYTVKTVNGLTSFEITRAAPAYQPEVTVLKKWSDTEAISLSPSDFGITVGGGFSSLTTPTSSDLLSSSGFEDNKLKVVLSTLTEADADKTAEVRCNFIPSSGNYNTVSLKLIIKVVGKDIIPAEAITLNGVSDYAYNGNGLSNVTASVETANLTGYSDENATTAITYSGKLSNGNAYTSSNTAPTDPGVYTVRCEYSTDSHTGVAEKSYTISKKTVGYTGLTVNEKKYDGLKTATVSGTLAINGLVGSDVVTVDASGISYEFANADIGENIDVIPNTQPTIGGANAWKYIVEPLELSGKITKPDTAAVVGNSTLRLDSEDDVDAKYQDQLTGTAYTTVDELKDAMKAEAKKTISAIKSNNVQFFDFVLKQITGATETDAPAGTAADALIPYPTGTSKNNTFVLIHMKSDGTLEKITTRNTRNGIAFRSTFSPFMLTWTTTGGSSSSGGSSGSGGGGGGSSFDEDQSYFWSTVVSRIENAKSGDTIKVYADYYDQMSRGVMQALKENPDVTLVIDWYGGNTITIPAGTALKIDAGRVYYPLSYLAEKYENVKPALAPATNPTTGGKTTSIAAPAVDMTEFVTPAVTPAYEGIDEKQAELESTAAVSVENKLVEAVPETPTEVVDVITLDNGTKNTASNRTMGFAAIAVAVAALIVGVAAFTAGSGKKRI